MVKYFYIHTFRRTQLQNIIDKKSFKNIINVAISNIAKLLSSVLVGLLLPKIIGVTDYGYYKTFTLYGVYVGLFTFGITDGIYLKFGGKSYDSLDKNSFRFYSRFFFVAQLIFSGLVALISCICLPGEYCFIFLCLALYLLFYNITSYFQIVSQITGRFNELSLRNLIQSLLQAGAIAILYILSNSPDQGSYRLFTIIYVAITCFLAFWYVFTYRDIVLGKQITLTAGRKDIKEFVVIGIPLLVSNLSMLLLLSLDRQYVNILFETDTYAVYAFAYNMLSLFTTALAAISIVIYPTLKRTSKENLKASYSKLVFSILSLAFLGLTVYFPLTAFVPWFLPKYTDSLTLFRIIMPGLATSSTVTIVMHNYYKVLGENIKFFKNCLIVLITSFAANLVAYLFFGTTESISIASIIVLLVWYLLSERLFIKRYKISSTINTLYMLTVMAAFYVITIINVWWLGLFVYLTVFIVVRLAFSHINSLKQP